MVKNNYCIKSPLLHRNELFIQLTSDLLASCNLALPYLITYFAAKTSI